MTSIKRPLAASGAAVLMALALAACGGGASGAPTDASEADFCEAFYANTEDLSGGTELTEDDWDKIQETVDGLKDVGTPESIGDDEREGFEVYVDTLSDLSYDDAKDIADSSDLPGISDDENEKATAFITWAATTCVDESTGGATDDGATDDTATDEATE